MIHDTSKPHRFLNSYHHHNMVAPEFSSVNTFSVDSQNPYLNLPNPERPPNTTVNIQRDQLPQRDFTNRPQSPSFSPMDSSPPSEIDYAERVAASNNRMEVKMSNPTTDYFLVLMSFCRVMPATCHAPLSIWLSSLGRETSLIATVTKYHKLIHSGKLPSISSRPYMKLVGTNYSRWTKTPSDKKYDLNSVT